MALPETLDTASELGRYLLWCGPIHTAALGATENRRGACVDIDRHSCANFMSTLAGSIIFHITDHGGSYTICAGAVIPIWWAPSSIKTTR